DVNRALVQSPDALGARQALDPLRAGALGEAVADLLDERLAVRGAVLGRLEAGVLQQVLPAGGPDEDREVARLVLPHHERHPLLIAREVGSRDRRERRTASQLRELAS